MNHVDFDPKMASIDAYGNVTNNAQTYKGFVIDVGITVKVWHNDTFVGKYATIDQAKHAIDEIIE